MHVILNSMSLIQTVINDMFTYTGIKHNFGIDFVFMNITQETANVMIEQKKAAWDNFINIDRADESPLSNYLGAVLREMSNMSGIICDYIIPVDYSEHSSELMYEVRVSNNHVTSLRVYEGEVTEMLGIIGTKSEFYIPLDYQMKVSRSEEVVCVIKLKRSEWEKYQGNKMSNMYLEQLTEDMSKYTKCELHFKVSNEVASSSWLVGKYEILLAKKKMEWDLYTSTPYWYNPDTQGILRSNLRKVNLDILSGNPLKICCVIR